MKITNKPTLENNFKFNFYKFSSAREALAKIISISHKDNNKILIPAFIGYSPREGSGIFDPIRKSKIPYQFYRMDKDLNIDYNYIKNEIINNPGSIILLVHYWGFIDPSCEKIRQLAKENKCIIIEDFAHALFSFFNQPVLEFNFGFFSLHKMFHYSDGGVLISKNPIENLEKSDLCFFEYNIYEIIKTRILNYNIILNELKKINNTDIKVIRNDFGKNVPQTFPILINNNKLKEFLYFQLNQAGFGVVSLYYQLISEVDDTFINEKNISSCILNLPVHQDVRPELIYEMISKINNLCINFQEND